MNKDRLSKFINRSKEIIGVELSDEKKESVYEDEISRMLKEDHYMDALVEEDTKTKKEETVKKEEVEVKQVYTKPLEEVVTTSYLAADALIKGDIFVEGDLNLDGTIDGNVECHHNLKINGIVKGNVKAMSIIVGCEDMNGNVECEKYCQILEHVSINGDVIAENVKLDGSVKGTINAKGKVTLTKTAVLDGDCISSQIVIEEGATVKGNIHTSFTK